VVVAVGNQADKSPQPKSRQALTEDDEDDVERWRDLARTGPSYGRLFLERLLLSLIDAHPTKQVQNPEHVLHDREARLRDAMEALFNEEPSQKLLDDAALFWIAKQYIHDRAMRFSTERRAEDVGLSRPAGPLQPPLRSERELAQEASAKFYPKITDKSERLRKKWGRQKQRWLDLVRFHDDLPETFETQVLARIWVALAKAKVFFVPNSPAGSAMSEEQMLRTGLPEFEELVEILRSRRGPNPRRS
jgi:hypothetical protein